MNLRWASFDNNELTRIEGLEHCTLLEELSLNNNSISRLEGSAPSFPFSLFFPLYQFNIKPGTELCNITFISSSHCFFLCSLLLLFVWCVAGLCAMHRLTRLSINSNHLQCLDGDVLDQLPNLHFLSVENNIISSLHGVQRSRSLIELCVGNNDISTTRDIYHLKVRFYRSEYNLSN